MTKELASQYGARNEHTDYKGQRDGDAIAQHKSAHRAEDAALSKPSEDVPPRTFQCIRDPTKQEHPAAKCNGPCDRCDPLDPRLACVNSTYEFRAICRPQSCEATERRYGLRYIPRFMRLHRSYNEWPSNGE